MEYSNLSKYLTSKICKKTKKDNGIYFTPPSCVDKNIELLKPYFENIKTVLEPSCGSCEFIISLYRKFKKLKICHNPEFLTARTAVEDFANQNHIIIGKGINMTKSQMVCIYRLSKM